MSLFYLLQMLCSSSSTKNCTTDTSMLKSAWVSAPEIKSANWLIHSVLLYLFLLFIIIRVDQLWTRGLSHTTITATSSTIFSVSPWNVFIYIYTFPLTCSFQCKITINEKILVFVYRCWRPCTAGAAKPVAVGHHRWVHLPGLVIFFVYICG